MIKISLKEILNSIYSSRIMKMWHYIEWGYLW
jgi:hypothetical protein